MKKPILNIQGHSGPYKSGAIDYAKSKGAVKKVSLLKLPEQPAIEVVFDLKGSDLTEVQINMIEEAFAEQVQNLSSEQQEQLLENARKRELTGQKKEMVVSLLQNSQYLFEDHQGNGFVGINDQLFTSGQSDDLVNKLLNLGLRHELFHELAGRLSGKELFELEERLLQHDLTYVLETGMTAEDFKSTGLFSKNLRFVRQLVIADFVGETYVPSAWPDPINTRNSEDGAQAYVYSLEEHPSVVLKSPKNSEESTEKLFHWSNPAAAKILALLAGLFRPDLYEQKEAMARQQISEYRESIDIFRKNQQVLEEKGITIPTLHLGRQLKRLVDFRGAAEDRKEIYLQKKADMPLHQKIKQLADSGDIDKAKLLLNRWVEKNHVLWRLGVFEMTLGLPVNWGYVEETDDIYMLDLGGFTQDYQKAQSRLGVPGDLNDSWVLPAESPHTLGYIGNEDIVNYYRELMTREVTAEKLSELWPSAQVYTSSMEGLPLLDRGPMTWQGKDIEDQNIEQVKTEVKQQSSSLGTIEGKEVWVDNALISQFESFGYTSQDEFEDFLRTFLSEQFTHAPPH